MGNAIAPAFPDSNTLPKQGRASEAWAGPWRLLKDPFFWLIAAATLLHTLLHYATYIATVRPFLAGLPYFNLHALHEVEFIAIIAFTAYRYRWKGGLAMVSFTIVASIPYMLTPQIFGRAPRPDELRDRTIEVAATVGIGAFITFLIETMLAQKERAQRAWLERQANVNRIITLNTVSQAVEHSLDLKSTVARILQGLASNVEGRAFFLYLYDKNAKTFRLAGHKWVGPEEMPLVNIIPLEPPLARGLTQSIAVFRGSELPPGMRTLGGMVSTVGMGIRAAVPMRFVDELVGMLLVCSDRRTLPVEEMAMLSSLGYIMGLAVNSATTLDLGGRAS